MAIVTQLVRAEVLSFVYDEDGHRVPVMSTKCVPLEGWNDFDITFGPDGEQLFVPLEALEEKKMGLLMKKLMVALLLGATALVGSAMFIVVAWAAYILFLACGPE